MSKPSANLTIHEINNALIHKYEFNDNLVPKKIIVFNIPEKDITLKTPTKLQNWSELRKKSISSKLFDFSVRILTRRDLGTKFEPDSAYCDDETPKTSIIIEDLLSVDKKTIVGQRFWGFVYDEQYSVEKAITDFLATNNNYLSSEETGVFKNNNNNSNNNNDDEAEEVDDEDEESPAAKPKPKPRSSKAPAPLKKKEVDKNDEDLSNLIDIRTLVLKLYSDYLSNYGKILPKDMFER